MPRMWSNGDALTSIRDSSLTRLKHRRTSIIGMARAQLLNTWQGHVGHAAGL